MNKFFHLIGRTIRRTVFQIMFPKQRAHLCKLAFGYREEWHSTVDEIKRCTYEAERQFAKKFLAELED